MMLVQTYSWRIIHFIEETEDLFADACENNRLDKVQMRLLAIQLFLLFYDESFEKSLFFISSSNALLLLLHKILRKSVSFIHKIKEFSAK